MGGEIAKPEERLATAMKAFTEKLEQRVRAEVAESMPDAVIDGMVETTTRKLFFEPTLTRNPNHTYYNGQPEHIAGPSKFETLLIEAMKPIVEKRIESLIRESPEEIAAVVERVIKGGITRLFFASLEELIARNVLSNSNVAAETVLERLRERGVVV